MRSSGTIVITGGSGFIGSHLLHRLLDGDKGDCPLFGGRIVILDDLSTGRRSNIETVLAEHGDRVELVVGRAGDVLNVAKAVERFRPIRELYHLAAAVGVKLVTEQPAAMVRNNVEETAVVLEAARRDDAAVLIASSSEVYGKCPQLPLREDMELVYGPTTASRWCYGLTKAIDEHLALDAHRRLGVRAGCVRLFNTIGPRQVGRYGMVVPRFVAAAVRGQPLSVHGDGEQTRCFCDVRDVAAAMVRLIRCEGFHGQVVNLGSDREVTINELARRVLALSGSDAGLEHVPHERVYGQGFEDPPRRLPDLTKARNLVGFEASIPLERTLAELIALERGGDDTCREDPRRDGVGFAGGFVMMKVLWQMGAREPWDPPVVGDVGVEGGASEGGVGLLDVISPYMGVFFVAFAVAIVLTPVLRKLAVKFGVVDLPDLHRKAHLMPVAYLGGVAIFGGWLAGIMVSYFLEPALPHEGAIAAPAFFPLSIVLGAAAITVTGLIDDVHGIRARVKIGGQLFAAAALAWDPLVGIGIVEVALTAVGLGDTFPHIVIYTLGTLALGVMVVAACNSLNLLDGLDGLAAGITMTMMAGFLTIAAIVTLRSGDPAFAFEHPERLILPIATIGAILGFLPYNFKPASIFMGDAGSLLLGYLCITTILLSAQSGAESLRVVVASLIIFALPITDTSAAIIRRKLRGLPMSAPDAQHIHHLLRKRGLSVRQAVMVMYGVTGCFTLLGVLLVLLQLELRYMLAITAGMYGFIIISAYKYSETQLELERRHLKSDADRQPPAEAPRRGEKASSSSDRVIE